MSDDTIHDEDFQARWNWGLWRQVLRFALPYKRLLVAMAVVAILTACCDVAVPFLTGRIIDEVVDAGTESNLFGYGVAFAVVMTVFAMCIFTFILLAGRIATSICYDIRQASFEKLQELSFSYFDHRPVGWLMARLTSDCSGLSRIMGWALLDCVWGVCMILGISTVMFILNWQLALLVLTITPPLLFASRFFHRRLLLTSRHMRKANSHMTASYSEGLMGVRTTKSLVRQPQNLGEFQKLSSTMYGDSISNALYAAVFLPIVITLCSVGVGLALWFGSGKVIEGSITVGTLVVFIAYAGHLANPISEMAQTLTTLQGAQASAERIQQLFDTEPEVKESGDALVAPQESIDSIEFEDVGFAYRDGKPVLDEFRLNVKTGQTIALVGPTGGGKSTIVSLACRFYEPTNGRILINDIDYRKRSIHSLQSNLGIVLQTPHLFRDNVRENIRYGRLDATDDEVESVARLVNAHDFIADLQDGYDTDVGEGGNNLSTGQKQLISLARALLSNPQILVMDEATSSVDTETEALIQSAVDRVLSGRIAFVIAHRLSTIRNADQILLIADGQIAESGTHDQLMRQRGRYFDLYTNQFAQDQMSN